MANPQPDEYTKISNELLEHLISTPLSGNQWQVLMCIIRKTYGYHKKHDYLTNNQIIEATGLGKTVVSRCLTLLQKGNFITRNGHITGLQKDWELWQPELAKQLTKVSYPLDTQKKKETIQKKYIFPEGIDEKVWDAFQETNKEGNIFKGVRE